MLSVEKVLCIMSYYEYFELFCIILNIVSNIIRLQRITNFDLDTLPLTTRILNEIDQSTKNYNVHYMLF